MHWRNSNFQIAYFLAGKCRTPDGAYRMLMELREERDVAIKNYEAIAKRAEAKVLRAQQNLQSTDKAERLEAEADIAEVNATSEQMDACFKEANREIEFIDKLIEKIKPLRQFSHLPDHEAHQACQQEEWRMELLHRAENFLMSQGSIPAQELDIMRAHPDWKRLFPEIMKMTSDIKSGNYNVLESPITRMLENNNANIADSSDNVVRIRAKFPESIRNH